MRNLLKVNDPVIQSKISQKKSRSLQAPPQVTMKTIVFTQQSDSTGSWLQFETSHSSQTIHYDQMVNQPKMNDPNLKTISKLSSRLKKTSGSQKKSSVFVYKKQPYQGHHANSQKIQFMTPKSNRATIFILNSEPQTNILLAPKVDEQLKTPLSCNPKCFPKRPLKFKSSSTRTKTHPLQNQMHISVKKNSPKFHQTLTTRAKSFERNHAKDHEKRAVSSRTREVNRYAGLTPWNFQAEKQEEKYDQKLLESAHRL